MWGEERSGTVFSSVNKPTWKLRSRDKQQKRAAQVKWNCDHMVKCAVLLWPLHETNPGAEASFSVSFNLWLLEIQFWNSIKCYFCCLHVVFSFFILMDKRNSSLFELDLRSHKVNKFEDTKGQTSEKKRSLKTLISAAAATAVVSIPPCLSVCLFVCVAPAPAATSNSSDPLLC